MKGKWIAPRNTQNIKNCYFRARGIFVVEDFKESSPLHIAAESYYMLWVNGHCLGRGPARGSRGLNYYDTYEASPHLQMGRNIISVLVQCMNIPNFTTSPSLPALFVELENTICSDDNWDVLLNEEWRNEVEQFSPQVGFMEHRDYRLEPLGWNCGQDDAKWEKAVVVAPSEEIAGKLLSPRPVPPLKTVQHPPSEIAHVAIVPRLIDPNDMSVAKLVSTENHSDAGDLQASCVSLLNHLDAFVEIPPLKGGGCSIVFNFGLEIIGFFEIELTAPSGAIVDISYDENLEAGRTLPLRDEKYKMSDRYIMRQGRQKVGSTIHERGFHYVEVTLREFDAPIILHSVRGMDRRYPYSPRGAFFCSDFRLNRIWDICVETISACTTDTFNDCPWRERAFWVNDLMIENIVSLQAFGDPRINAHALRLAFSNVREDGWIPGVCPDSNDDSLVLIPTNLFLILMLSDYHNYTGDDAFLDEFLPKMQGILNLFSEICDEDGLLAPPKKFWNFFDWSYELNEMSLNGLNTSALNWLYCWALNTFADLMNRRDKNGESYKRTAESVAKAIDEKFWLDDERRYADWLLPDGAPSAESSQLAHSFALLSGSLPKKREKAAIDALINPNFLMPELYLHHFVFAAMKTNGIRKEAIERIKKYWGKVAESGSPTLWEVAIHGEGKDAFGNAGSLCHGFGCTPIDYFQTTLLGVTPMESGFKTFSIAPVPGDLKHAKGAIPTPQGTIRVEWKNKRGALEIKFTVPPGTKAVLQGREYERGKHQETLDGFYMPSNVPTPYLSI